MIFKLLVLLVLLSTLCSNNSIVSAFVSSSVNIIQQHDRCIHSHFGGVSEPLRQSQNNNNNNNNNRSCPPLSMFGGLFGENNDKKDGADENELALLKRVVKGGDLDGKFESLSDYISQWSKLFETDPKGMRLTTPVQVVPSSSLQIVENNDDDETETETKTETETEIELETDILAEYGVCLLFKKLNTGYKSKDEEAASGRRVEPAKTTTSAKKKEAEMKKEGGVEIVVEKLDGEIQVRVKRCNFDEDTTSFKEMSEETIVKELRKAIDIWKKQ